MYAISTALFWRACPRSGTTLCRSEEVTKAEFAANLTADIHSVLLRQCSVCMRSAVVVRIWATADGLTAPVAPVFMRGAVAAGDGASDFSLRDWDIHIFALQKQQAKS